MIGIWTPDSSQARSTTQGSRAHWQKCVDVPYRSPSHETHGGCTATQAATGRGTLQCRSRCLQPLYIVGHPYTLAPACAARIFRQLHVCWHAMHSPSIACLAYDMAEVWFSLHAAGPLCVRHSGRIRLADQTASCNNVPVLLGHGHSWTARRRCHLRGKYMASLPSPVHSYFMFARGCCGR